MGLKINLEEFKKEVTKCVTEAVRLHHGNGEVQLYIEQRDGEKVDYMLTEFPDKNSWVEGRGLILVMKEEWFDPIDGLDLNDELSACLSDELAEEFKKYGSSTWGCFAQHFPDQAEEFLSEWRQNELAEIIPGRIDEVIRDLESLYDVEWI
ncbi:hypothetical protein B7C51_24435 [Paenibacillus larvae subsp. pulvifaciens]|uniref:Uncharacterized protein n=1 Tax=Paenibacillus larvae subsp. pulvifaciens TaxID=1477 RepID=A0A1V0UYQ9_9BACL|nr:hypothetical protein [Paenibacillus larvae]ARF70316.1 hypothetical protein B7C51_24435 [Paenibacillus larvae subsp. pulvifaciens]